jgi:hypothetical protein
MVASSYQSGSQLVLLPIWLPIGALTNLASKLVFICRYQFGSRLVFLMTSWRRKLSTERHPLEDIVQKKNQFGDTNLDFNWLYITESGTQLPIGRPIWSFFIVMTCYRSRYPSISWGSRIVSQTISSAGCVSKHRWLSSGISMQAWNRGTLIWWSPVPLSEGFTELRIFLNI